MEQTKTSGQPLQGKYYRSRRHSPKDVTMLSQGTFPIRKRKEKGCYELTFEGSQVLPSCQCRSWQRKRLPCKHFFAVLRHYPNRQWNQLSTSYINGPRLVHDEAIITTPGFDNVKPKVIICSKENRSEDEIDSIGPEREKPDTCINPTQEHCDELPSHRRKQQVAVSFLPEKKRRSCRDMLLRLRSLTYLIQEHDALNQFKEDLGRILTLAKKTCSIRWRAND